MFYIMSKTPQCFPKYGVIGPYGVPGPRGHRGHHGHHGHAGKMGPMGPVGPMGPPGNNDLGNTVYVGVTTISSQRKLASKEIPLQGDFSTLKSAVDNFNSSATDNTVILLDAGHYVVTDTIIVNNPNYVLKIKGSGYNVTYLGASNGLAGKPMFKICSESYYESFSADGSTLADYGSQAGENFVTFDTNPNFYCEFIDFEIASFNIGFSDIIGVSWFMFNFTIDNCIVGVNVNYSTTTDMQFIDCEVGDMYDCGTCVNLQQTGSGKQGFIFGGIFFRNGPEQLVLEYNGGSGAGHYLYGQPAHILNCYNNGGNVFLGAGFDFTDPINADIEVMGCNGVEDKTPFIYLSSSNNKVVTPIPTLNNYVPVILTNCHENYCKFSCSTGNSCVTYLSNHIYNLRVTVSGSFVSGTDEVSKLANMTIAVHRTLHVDTVTGNGSIVTVTTSTPHHLIVSSQIQMTEWSGGSGVWNGIFPVESVLSANSFTYLSTGSGTATGGLSGFMMSPMYFNLHEAYSPVYNSYQFTSIVFVQEVIYGDVLGVCVAGSDTTEHDSSVLMLQMSMVIN
jgi:hypothetical protein